MWPRILHRLFLYSQGILGLEGEDVILASFPRSGSTWLRFILCNLVSLDELGGETVDFRRLNATMPELGVSNLLRPWPHSTIPRIVKTHRPYSKLFRSRRSVLVLRDPRDVMTSYYHYELGKEQPRFSGSFDEFLRHPRYGLEAWCRHCRSWIERAGLKIRYEALRKDDLGVFVTILDYLGVAADSETVSAAVERSRLDRIREVESAYGHDDQRFKNGFHFARSGRSGDWRTMFSERDLELYAALQDKYGIRLYADNRS
jgi:estrone sulfotransferase